MKNSGNIEQVEISKTRKCDCKLNLENTSQVGKYLLKKQTKKQNKDKKIKLNLL